MLVSHQQVIVPDHPSQGSALPTSFHESHSR
jgi:hypothetical protein